MDFTLIHSVYMCVACRMLFIIKLHSERIFDLIKISQDFADNCKHVLLIQRSTWNLDMFHISKDEVPVWPVSAIFSQFRHQSAEFLPFFVHFLLTTIRMIMKSFLQQFFLRRLISHLFDLSTNWTLYYNCFRRWILLALRVQLQAWNSSIQEDYITTWKTRRSSLG